MNPCGPRQAAFKNFKTALKNGEDCLLLIDSEDPVKDGTSPWLHLEGRKDDSMPKPEAASDSHCHLMVVTMESWLIADPDNLANYYGKGFSLAKLPKGKSIEKIPKEEVYKSLKEAISMSKRKYYKKGDDAFALLGRTDPEKVKASSPWAKRFFDHLETLLG